MHLQSPPGLEGPSTVFHSQWLTHLYCKVLFWDLGNAVENTKDNIGEVIDAVDYIELFLFAGLHSLPNSILINVVSNAFIRL